MGTPPSNAGGSHVIVAQSSPTDVHLTFSGGLGTSAEAGRGRKRRSDRKQSTRKQLMMTADRRSELLTTDVTAAYFGCHSAPMRRRNRPREGGTDRWVPPLGVDGRPTQCGRGLGEGENTQRFLKSDVTCVAVFTVIPLTLLLQTVESLLQ